MAETEVKGKRRCENKTEQALTLICTRGGRKKQTESIPVEIELFSFARRSRSRSRSRGEKERAKNLFHNNFMNKIHTYTYMYPVCMRWEENIT